MEEEEEGKGISGQSEGGLATVGFQLAKSIQKLV
jgi:hypothetical protein